MPSVEPIVRVSQKPTGTMTECAKCTDTLRQRLETAAGKVKAEWKVEDSDDLGFPLLIFLRGLPGPSSESSVKRTRL